MSNIFTRAAEVIRENFTTNTYVDDSGNVCMEGALRLARLETSDGRRWLTPMQFLNRVRSDVSPLEANHLAGILPACDGTCFEKVASHFRVVNCGVSTMSAARHAASEIIRQQSEEPDSLRRVHHYNDFHCDGGHEAAGWLEKAGESWDNEHSGNG